MLRLMLLRHAKAVTDRGDGDFSRILSARGMADAAALGLTLAEEMLIPDLMMVSSASRTSATASQLLAQWPQPVSVLVSNSLYNATADALLLHVQNIEACPRVLMLIGHNPGIAELAMQLTGYGDRYAHVRMSQRFAPCGLAILDFDNDVWPEISKGHGRLDRFVSPGEA